MGGFRDGELITISGYTKNGKTLLAQTLTASFMEQRHFPLWFSYEVPTRQFIKQFPFVPHLFMPTELKAHAMDWVEERILESLQKFNTRAVFIDHLHFLFDLGRSRNASLDIGQVIRKLKMIAIQNEIVIFLLCHTQQPKEGSEGLGYEKIRDSSFVAQESDSVIMIARKTEVMPNYAEARVEFHRRTGVMKEMVYLEKKGWWLTERSNEDEKKADD
jgi:replicative DNA helicase